MEFIDRELELKLLEKEWGNKPSFVVVYGRRRLFFCLCVLLFSCTFASGVKCLNNSLGYSC
ncbi:hypothetical protein [Pyrococcus kukulkanii]|uniref:Uncharacterized protein n=1 Tax=Pyrococcus kukulkanii TaxID=1609559 RepID=A0ABV4T6B4_9EURY